MGRSLRDLRHSLFESWESNWERTPGGCLVPGMNNGTSWNTGTSSVMFSFVPLPLLPRRVAVHSSQALVSWSSRSRMDVRRRAAWQQRVGQVRGEDGAMRTKEGYGGNASPGERGVVRLRPELAAHQVVARAQVTGRWGASTGRERKEGTGPGEEANDAAQPIIAGRVPPRKPLQQACSPGPCTVATPGRRIVRPGCQKR